MSMLTSDFTAGFVAGAAIASVVSVFVGHRHGLLRGIRIGRRSAMLDMVRTCDTMAKAVDDGGTLAGFAARTIRSVGAVAQRTADAIADEPLA